MKTNEDFGSKHKRRKKLSKYKVLKKIKKYKSRPRKYIKYSRFKHPHVGYIRNFPLFRVNNRNYYFYNNRYLPLRRKYWNQGVYFKKPFILLNNNINNMGEYYYIGKIVNLPYNKSFYLFEKKEDDLYKYLIFENTNYGLKFNYYIPPRSKVYDGDTLQIRYLSGFYGPFTFIRK